MMNDDVNIVVPDIQEVTENNTELDRKIWFSLGLITFALGMWIWTL